MGDHASDGGGGGGEAGDLTAAALEAGRLLFASDCVFLRGAAKPADLPPPGAPEIAFAGRSNVGKSSLVNALTGRSTLARVAKAPGRTQQLNFFALGPDAARRRLTLVDMPGYGFAQVSKAMRHDWSALVQDYLRGRAGLRRVLVLVDSRHGVKPSDERIFDLLDETAVSWQIALTKIDQLQPREQARARDAAAAAIARRPAAHPVVAATSAFAGEGIPDLRATLAALAAIG